MSTAYATPWDAVSEQEKSEILTDLRLSDYDPDIPATIFKQKKPSFYPGYTLLQADIELLNNQRELKCFIWKKQSAFIQLDWSSSPVHEINDTDALNLNKDTVKDYLHFFCDFVTADNGPFTIIESTHNERFQGKYQEYIDAATFNVEDRDESVTAKAPLSEQKEAILSKIRPLEIKKEDGKFTANSCIWYGTMLFEITLSVDAEGMVEMLDDNPLLEFPSTGITPWHINK
jgi:hypothetical protein